MNRLFWKFFLSILLAQITAAVGVSAVFWLREQHAGQINLPALDTGPRADDAIHSASLTLQFGGVDALKNLLLSMQHHRIYALDEHDQDLLHRTLSPSVIKAARDQLGDNTARGAVREVQRDGQRYLLFLPNPPTNPDSFAPPLLDSMPLQASPNPPPDPIGMPPMQPPSADNNDAPPFRKITPLMLIIASLLASLLFAFLLAAYFSRRIIALRLAFELAAKGQLAPRFQGSKLFIEDELSELGQDFDRMTQQLRAMMERQTRLMHDVSHELRSPLARLQAAVGLAFQQPEKTSVYLERIERESVRMDKLVGELLTLARLEAGAFNAGFEQFPISELIADIVDDAQFEASLKQCKIELEGKTQIWVNGRIELIARAIENILRNAIKYSPEKQIIQVNVDTCGDTDVVPHLNASSQEAELYLRLRILDKGRGVPVSELRDTFLPFYRGKESADQVQGHGLGLAIAQQVVLAHHGSISANAREGGGLCVEICLPISSPSLKQQGQQNSE